MSKADIEQTIVNGILAIKADHDEGDKTMLDWYSKEVANGYQGDKPFLYNGYIYMSELCNVICKAMYDHPYERHETAGKESIGVPRMWALNYKPNTNADEEKAINAIIKNMLNKNKIKLSKSHTMVKILF